MHSSGSASAIARAWVGEPMDASTLQFHRELLRFLKGAAKSYERWIADQAAALAVENLKERKEALTRESVVEEFDTTCRQE